MKPTIWLHLSGVCVAAAFLTWVVLELLCWRENRRRAAKGDPIASTVNGLVGSCISMPLLLAGLVFLLIHVFR
jgi:hypothetical protein